jgi:hypothetical protein
MEIVQYTCCRCGYHTKDKNNMRNHLYKRQKTCPATVDDIELTDEIKNYILENRVYKKPKVEKVEKIPKSIIINKEELHYIYLIRHKENVEHNENVYKIGKTIVKELTVNIQRLTSYGKGTEVILIQQCNNAHNCERIILKTFKQKFTKHKFGNEYFIGDPIIMNKIIFDIIFDQYQNMIQINNDLEYKNTIQINNDLKYQTKKLKKD